MLIIRRPYSSYGKMHRRRCLHASCALEQQWLSGALQQLHDAHGVVCGEKLVQARAQQRSACPKRLESSHVECRLSHRVLGLREGVKVNTPVVPAPRRSIDESSSAVRLTNFGGTREDESVDSRGTRSPPVRPPYPEKGHTPLSCRKTQGNRLLGARQTLSATCSLNPSRAASHLLVKHMEPLHVSTNAVLRDVKEVLTTVCRDYPSGLPVSMQELEKRCRKPNVCPVRVRSCTCPQTGCLAQAKSLFVSG